MVATQWLCRWCYGGILLAVLALVPAQGRAQPAEPDHPFRFGFSTALMPETKENDARAAMKIWVEAVIKSGAVKADPNAVFTQDLSALLNALQSRELDGVTFTVREFYQLKGRIDFNRLVCGVIDGNAMDEYVLLVNQDGDVKTVDDLKGRSLGLQRHSRTCLALMWLDTVLLERRLKPTREFVGQIVEDNKLMRVVLPVFFRKSDACLVTRKGFKAMGDLNPQVNQRLRAIATSPAIVPTGMYFRAGFPKEQQDKCVEQLTKVHTSPAGQQVLTVFQTERLDEQPFSVLDSALALMEKHERLTRAGNDPAPETPKPLQVGQVTER